MKLFKEKPMLSAKAIFFDTNAASRYMAQKRSIRCLQSRARPIDTKGVPTCKVGLNKLLVVSVPWLLIG
jgi:hypothetical protein